MCTAVLKLSVLILSLTWCSDGVDPAPAPVLQSSGVHIHFSPEGIEISIRWPHRDAEAERVPDRGS